MTAPAIVSISICTIEGAEFDGDGELIKGEQSEPVQITYCDTSDMLDVENAIADVKDSLINWSA